MSSLHITKLYWCSWAVDWKVRGFITGRVKGFFFHKSRSAMENTRPLIQGVPVFFFPHAVKQPECEPNLT